jgi:hypothetical protein
LGGYAISFWIVSMSDAPKFIGYRSGAATTCCRCSLSLSLCIPLSNEEYHLLIHALLELPWQIKRIMYTYVSNSYYVYLVIFASLNSSHFPSLKIALSCHSCEYLIAVYYHDKRWSHQGVKLVSISAPGASMIMHNSEHQQDCTQITIGSTFISNAAVMPSLTLTTGPRVIVRELS